VYSLNSAYLHNSIFNIELKRRELEQQNLKRFEVKRWFEDHYRVFSKKSAFTCLCCNKPVNMNLTKDEGRPFYFRHNDESEWLWCQAPLKDIFANLSAFKIHFWLRSLKREASKYMNLRLPLHFKNKGSTSKY
jgi:hypothetical protein